MAAATDLLDSGVSGSLSTSLQPQGLWHLVALAATERVSKGGIALPDGLWEKWTTGVVQQSGPGLDLATGLTLAPVAQPGDVLLFEQADFHVLNLDERVGFVLDTALLGWLEGDDLLPLNDWVLVETDRAPENAGTLAIADFWRRRPCSGVVRDHGPGRLITHGKHRGFRRTVTREAGYNLVGSRVRWGRYSDPLCCGVQSLEYLLIRASDLIAVEEA
jgi:co-chaperonin GroES (HSP10)